MLINVLSAVVYIIIVVIAAAVADSRDSSVV
jgi:hypothetical protein